MTKELWKGNLIVLIIALYLEKRFLMEFTKNPNTNVWACPDFTFSAVGYHSPPPPPESQHTIHIYYAKYEHTFTCKWISWDSGDAKNPICLIQKMTI